VALLAFAASAVPFCTRTDSEWDSVFVRAGGQLWRGEDFYGPGSAYLYPPFSALTALPFTPLPHPVLRGAWLLLNLASVTAMLLWGWRAAGGGRLEGGGAPRGQHAAAVLGTLCGLTYVHNCLAHQQTDLVIGALLAGGCLLLRRSRALAAATCLGLAAAMKCTPLLFAPYLVWRRRPGAAAWLVVVALWVNLMPDLVHPAPGGGTWLSAYVGRFLAPLAGPRHYVGAWGSEPVYNQSVAGAFHRWFLTTPDWRQPECPVLPRPATPHPLVLRVAAYGTSLALLAATLWAAGRPWRRAEELPGEDRVGLECGAVLLLMLLLSPMSSKAHFGILVLPGFCVARAAAASGRRWGWALVAVAAALGLAGNKDPLGERLYTLTLWLGSVTLQTLILLAGCLALLRRPLDPVAATLPVAATSPALPRAA
jgi:hypothetical protein